MDQLFDISSYRRLTWVNGPLIVGVGPAGLAVAASLRHRRIPFVILDRAGCLASLWQLRTYDRLKLHLPKGFCELPLLPFPAHYPEYPTRVQFIDYLETYAKHFDINPRYNEAVQSARYDDTSGLWRVRAATSAGDVEYVCQSIVVATGENAENVVPEMEGMENFGGKVTHVSDYRSGEPYRGQNVLVVGCGNSGMEVSLDLCNHGAKPAMVVRDSVHVLPREVLGKSTFEIAVLLMKWLPVWIVDKILVVVAWLVLGSLARYGIRRPSAGPLELKGKDGRTPVLDIGTLEKIGSGEIKVVPGVRRFVPGGAELVDGRVVEADAVLLATGYRSNVARWLEGSEEFFTKDGYPKTPFPNSWKGRNGLYAAGFTKRGLSGISMDAIKIAEDISKAWKEETKQAREKPTACHRRCISQF